MILGAAFADKDTRAELVKKVTTDLFVDDGHASIWSAIVQLERRGLDVDTSAVLVAVAGKVDGSYLNELVEAYPFPPANLEHHISGMRWDKLRVDAIRGPVAELITALRDGSTPPDKLRGLGRQISAAFDQSVDKRYLHDATTLVRSMSDVIAARASQGVYAYGIDGLDIDHDTQKHRLIPGAAPGKTTLITGVSGSGKSAVSARIALEQARMRRPVLYGAWEMRPGPTLELLTQMSLADQDPSGPWTRYNLGIGDLTKTQLKHFEECAKKIAKWIRFFDPPFQHELRKRYNNDQALDLLSQQIADSGCEVVVLDLWERCIPDGEPSAERRALFRQQQIAEETQTHCILVCQQRLKEVEASEDKRPRRDTILGSSAWVDIADTIIGVHRPALWKPSLGDDIMELLVLKQRFARWPMWVEFGWNGESVQFSNPRNIEVRGAMPDEASVGKFLAASGKGNRGRRRAS